MSAQKTNKNRKYGRNKKWCEAYRARGQREKNKKRRLLQHLRRGKHNSRAIALMLHSQYRVKFKRNPVSSETGPYKVVSL